MGLFLRYAPEARRAVFFARETALRAGAEKIDSEHILLGLLADKGSIASSSFGLQELFAADAAQQASLTTSRSTKDLPLASDGKRILAYSAEEAARLGEYWVDSDHMVLGILRERDCHAAIRLNDAGLTIDAAREVVNRNRNTRPSYGSIPFLWPLEKPISRIGKLNGLIYLVTILILVEVLGQKYCASVR
jgi:ATP-dependent Clp protease ATP-binding subunit ClpC